MPLPSETVGCLRFLEDGVTGLGDGSVSMFTIWMICFDLQRNCTPRSVRRVKEKGDINLKRTSWHLLSFSKGALEPEAFSSHFTTTCLPSPGGPMSNKATIPRPPQDRTLLKRGFAGD